MAMIGGLPIAVVTLGAVPASGLNAGNNVMAALLSPAWQVHTAAPGSTEPTTAPVFLRDAPPAFGEAHVRGSSSEGLAAFGAVRFGVLEAVLAECDELDNEINCVCRPGRYPAFGLRLHEHRFVMYALPRTRTCVCKVSCISARKACSRAKCEPARLPPERLWHEQAFARCADFAGTFLFHLPRLPKLKPVGAMALTCGLGGWISERSRTTRLTTP